MKFRRALIEITNACNLRCPFCAASARPPAFMPAGLFEKTAAQAACLAPVLSLHVLGEPFLHPELPALLAACSRLGAGVNLVTNGTLLGKFGPELFREPCLRQVTVSLQALGAMPVEARPALLEELAAFARSRPPALTVGFRLRAAPGDAFAAETAAGLAALFGAAPGPAGRPLELAPNTFLNRAPLFAWRSPRPGGKPCLGLSHHFGVLCGGEVVPCCADYDGALALGSVKDAPLADILASPRALALRRSLAAGRDLPAWCGGCGFLGPS